MAMISDKVVVLSRQCTSRKQRQLSDSVHYQKLEKDSVPTYTKEIAVAVKTLVC